MSYLLEFELVADLRRPGCPVCRGIARVAEDWTRGLLRDDINSPRVRELLQRAGGLCPRHLRLAVAVAEHDNDPMGLALLTEFLLAVTVRRLEESPTRRGSRRVRPGGRARLLPASCPACESEDRRADTYLELIEQAGPGTDAHRLVEADSHGLCLAHIARGLERARHPEGSARLVRVGLRRAGRLQHLLEQFLAKQVHQRRRELREEEIAAPAEAAAWLAGDSGRPGR